MGIFLKHLAIYYLAVLIITLVQVVILGEKLEHIDIFDTRKSDLIRQGYSNTEANIRVFCNYIYCPYALIYHLIVKEKE